MTLAAGARLGSYEIIAPIGVGGMGEVYRARDTTLNRDVALKVLPRTFTLPRRSNRACDRPAKQAAPVRLEAERRVDHEARLACD
jgi:serine/threonine protein kinase